MKNTWGGQRILPELHIRDNAPSHDTPLEEKVKTSRIINGRKTIGTLNIPNQSINALIRWEIYFIDDLFSKTVKELRSMKISSIVIEDIESILQFQNPDFTGFKEN